MRKIKVLAVVRSKGPGNALAPILAALREMGHEVYFFAEAVGQAKNILSQPFEVLEDKRQLSLQIAAFAPDVVLSGLSWPRTLEGALDEEAKIRGIPLVQVEDYWGCFTRASEKPDLLITIDTVSEKLIHAWYSDMHTVVAGFAGILPVEPRESIRRSVAMIKKETGAKLIVLPDCGPEAQSIWPIICASALMSALPIVLVPKPKRYEGPLPEHTETWEAVYAELLGPLRKKGMVREIEGPTAEVVVLADATASGFSTLLMRAAYEGNYALTIWTPLVCDLLKKETKMEMSPLMAREGFPVLTVPKSLDEIFALPPPRCDLKPLDAARAAQAIIELFA